jgi:6-pyruvoyltetrahydropterin/6-carboxytetrahydropterin synthase
MIAHRIQDPVFGKAQQLHGATLAIDLRIHTARLDLHGVVVDIGLLRGVLRAVLDDLDYTNLDEHAAFANTVSTTERIAEFIANRVAERLESMTGVSAQSLDGAVLQVMAHESPVAYAGYERALRAHPLATFGDTVSTE